MEFVRLGFEYGTGEEVKLSLGHTVWTGITQLSGKTTGIESVGMRTGKRVIAFITKSGEESFQDSTKIKPFFRERADWEFIKGLIESMMKYRIRGQEQAKIIQLTRESGGNSLSEFKKKLDEKLASSKSGYNLDIYTNLHAYLEKIIPRVYDMEYSRELELVDGINVIDLEKFSMDVEIQGLIIASVLDEVQANHTDIIVAIPEFWKFAPQERGSPCKQSITSFAKQGAAKRNFLFFDSQELASTDKEPLKQCSNWIMGYQTERNEVKHTIDQLPVPKKKKPDQDMIQNLRTGEFYVTMKNEVKKVFVQAFWVTDADARDVALGRKTIKDLPKRPKSTKTLKEYNKITEFEPKVEQKIREKNLDSIEHYLNDYIERTGVILSNRIKEVKDELNERISAISNISKNTEVDLDLIVKKVLEKMPRITGQNIVYNVSPLEKIKKDFIESAKEKILKDIADLNPKQRQMLKYLEAREVGVPVNEICIKCFFMKGGSGGYGTEINQLGAILAEKQFTRKHQNGKFMPLLKQRIEELLRVHGATDEEIKQLYDHIIFELLEGVQVKQ